MSRFVPTLIGMLTAAVQLPAQTAAIEPVLQAELAFARLAGEKGIRTAFLAWMTGDASVFSPRLTTARAFYGPEPGDAGHLAWQPEAMGLSAAGDLAWSHGPWTYAAQKGGAVLVHGHFLSVWRKQADGGWKVVADIGVPHAAPGQASTPFMASRVHMAAGGVRPDAQDATGRLREQEARLSSAWAELGGPALLPDLAREARVLRPGRLPLRDAADIRKALEGDRPGPRWEAGRVEVARSGDLAWTCGEAGPDDRGLTASFLRIWTCEAETWKVLFDVRLPHPARPK